MVNLGGGISKKINIIMPLLTVVMATHKEVQFSYLSKAVESILCQSFSDFEFIIICDGPLTFKHDNYLLALEKKHSFLVVIRLDRNRGPGAARNIGIKKSSGKYIAIMDSDDIAVFTRLELQYDFLERHNDIAIVGGFCDVIDDVGVVVGKRKLPLSPKLLRLYSLFFCPLNNPTVMGRGEVFKKYLYDEKLRQGEDYRLWVSLLSNNYKIANINSALIQFRVSDDLYKRRSGFSKGVSDIVNRLYAMRLSPIYLLPFVFLFAVASFGVRFLPVSAIRFLTTKLELVREKLIH